MGFLRQGDEDPDFKNNEIDSLSSVEEREYRLSFSGEYRFSSHLKSNLGYGFQYLENEDRFRQQLFGGISWSWN